MVCELFSTTNMAAHGRAFDGPLATQRNVVHVLFIVKHQLTAALAALL